MFDIEKFDFFPIIFQFRLKGLHTQVWASEEDLQLRVARI